MGVDTGTSLFKGSEMEETVRKVMGLMGTLVEKREGGSEKRIETFERLFWEQFEFRNLNLKP